MLSQGTYRIKMRMYYLEDKHKIFAQPYLSPEKKYSYKKIQPEHQAIIIDTEYAFATQMFYIKFCSHMPPEPFCIRYLIDFHTNQKNIFSSDLRSWVHMHNTIDTERGNETQGE